jgi:AcrR family transcriptional regulator
MSSAVERPRDSPRGPLPRGPHSLTREEVAANQRERLMRGMIDALGEKSYTKTTVSDVIKRAGVSRKAFYEHFSNKEDCLLATYDSVVAAGMSRISAAYRNGASPHGGARAAITALFERVIVDPNALRLVMVEIGAAGPAGIARREQLILTYEQVLRESLGLESGPGVAANPILRAVVGGLNKVLYTQVVSGTYSRLPTLVDDLVEWATCYYPPPRPMLDMRDDPADAPRARMDLGGGRALGTLSIGFPANGRRGEHGVSHSLVVHSQRERILDAVANLIAVHGYAGLTVEAITNAAGVSLQAFYEHFESKEDAFLVAYEIGHGKGLGIVERAFVAEPDWRNGVRAGIAALFDFLACEPAFARLALVDALVVSPRTAERSNVGVNAYAQMLLPGLEEAPSDSRPPKMVVEAVVGGLFELCLHHALHERLHELPGLVPRAAYVALTPFIGPDEAARVAAAEQ